ncbi:MAG: holo-ACP synthase [Actinomycetota bacterium]
MAIVGVGIDAVEIDRFRELLARRTSMRARLFSPDELDVVAARHDDAPSLAARFAAKEATMKSLGLGLGAFGFHECEILRAESGAPLLRTSGRLVELEGEHGVTSWHVSLTHTDSMASAVVVAES